MRIFIVLMACFFPGIAFASNGIVINEIAWMGSEVPGVDPGQWWRYEWVELYNASSESVSLAGWKLELLREDLEFRIPLRGSIDPQSYFLIASSSKIPNADLNYQNLGGKFSNSGQEVLLKDSLGKAADSVDAKAKWPAGDNERKYTMERTQDGTWQTSVIAGGTPKQENSKPFSLAKTEKGERPFQKTSSSVLPLFIASLAAFLSAGASLALKKRFEHRPRA